MCDTIYVDAASTRSRRVLFAKNSDRQRNEAQAVELYPAQEHPADSSVRCTYISVPQAARTLATLICRPFWMWGAEMGVNEHGVAIGNEGLYSRIPAPIEPALTGMDLLRLALERSRTAEEAVSVITSLLAKYGQGGNCGHLVDAYYHNGFLIADSSEAYAVETVGREWVLERVHGMRAMSNQYSVGRHFEQMSAATPSVLKELGWDGVSRPDPAQLLADPKLVHVGSALGRMTRATSVLKARGIEISLADVLAVLRDHSPAGQPERSWSPREALPYSLCIHAGAGDRISQTTCSLAAEIGGELPICWVTGTSAPCISIFKPMIVGLPSPHRNSELSDKFDGATLWWAHEKLHRRALACGLESVLAEISEERDALERDFQAAMTPLNRGTTKELEEAVRLCWSRAAQTEQRWLQWMMGAPTLGQSDYERAWESLSREAGLQLR